MWKLNAQRLRPGTASLQLVQAGCFASSRLRGRDNTEPEFLLGKALPSADGQARSSGGGCPWALASSGLSSTLWLFSIVWDAAFLLLSMVYSQKHCSFSFRCQTEFAELTASKITFSFQGTDRKIPFCIIFKRKKMYYKSPTLNGENCSLSPVKSHKLTPVWAVAQCHCHCQAPLCGEVTLFTSLGTSYFHGRWKNWGQIGKATSGPNTSFFYFMATLFQMLLKEFW